MSNNLLNALKSCPIDLSISVGLTTVCIDNEGIRSQILTDKKIEIVNVPCVLIVYRTGQVEKYEGSNAFQWIDETVSKFIPRVTEPQQERFPQKQKAAIKKTLSRRVTKEQYESDEEEPTNKNQRKVKFEEPKISKKVTTMEELGIEPNTQSSDTEFNQLKNSAQQVNGSESGSESTSVSGNVKGKDLMAAAMAMQKERDLVESNKPRSNGDIVTNNRPV
jgi:hypothetical protein